MKAYKGFDKDLKCLGYQYEVGKDYEHPGEVKLCPSEADVARGKGGFHACENPLDVLGYYNPADSRYCEVELDGVSEEKSDDSKRCGKKIHVGLEIGLSGLISAGVKFILDRVDWDNNKISNTGYRSAATNTGDCSAATNTGYRSAATNTGYCSAATNTGDCSAATNTGYRSAATNTGDCSAATNTGNQSAATNTGDYSAATNTGNQSAATNTGYRSAATNTGYYSAATNTGDYSAATNTGNRSAATNTGNRSAATVEGQDSVAIATGFDSKVKGSLGCAIVAVERGKWNGKTHPLLAIKSGLVDGEKLKVDTFYKVVNNEWVEC